MVKIKVSCVAQSILKTWKAINAFIYYKYKCLQASVTFGYDDYICLTPLLM